MSMPVSTCCAPLCGYSVPQALARCPECGRKMLSAEAVRRRGLIMLAAGSLLLSLMGATLFVLTPLLTNPGFSGTPEQARTVIQLFWLMLAFGAVGACAGAWQVVL